jgi:uncharacterized protein (DUF2384 family)
MSITATSNSRDVPIEQLVREVFGDEEAARSFLDLPNPALAHRIPREIAKTKQGVTEVKALLHRFLYGDYT